MAETRAQIVLQPRAPSLLSVVLALSLVLNLFMIGGYAYSRWVIPGRSATPGAHRLERMASRLPLRADQQKPLEDFRSAIRAAQSDLDVANASLRQEAWAELTKPTPDPQKVIQLLGEMSLHWHAYQVNATAALIRFMAALTPEQRASFARSVLSRHEPAAAAARQKAGN